MRHTWIAIIASLLMGIDPGLIFIFAVRKDYLRNAKKRERRPADWAFSASASLKTSLQEPSE
jgi:hypothetical protein